MKLYPIAARLFSLSCAAWLCACATAGPSAAGAIGSENSAYGAFLAARFANAQQDPAAAADYYARALQLDPKNAGLARAGFLSALQAGSQLADTFSAQVSGNLLVDMLNGNSAAMAGRFGEAQSNYARLPNQDVTGLMRPILTAWAQFGAGNAQQALATLTAQPAGGPFGVVFTLNAALIADAAGDTQDAKIFYAHIDGAEPDLRLAQILASWQARRGNLVAAEQELNALGAAHPDLQLALPALHAQINKPVVVSAQSGLAETYLTIAGAITQPQQRFLQIVFLQFALSLEPDLTPARLLLASAQSDAGDVNAKPSPSSLHEALASLAPVTPQDALYIPVALQRATILTELGKHEQSVLILKGLSTTAPGNVALLAMTGDALRDEQHFGEAKVYYGKAINGVGKLPPPGAWSLYFDRGICEDQLGNWQDAEADMLTARQLAPNQPYLLNYLGYSWALRGEKLPQAKAMLEHAVSIDPNDGAVIDSLGFIEMRMGKTREAVTLLTKAVELTPDDAEVNAHLGDAFWQAGQKLQANYQWQRALTLNPDAKLKSQINENLSRFATPTV